MRSMLGLFLLTCTILPAVAGRAGQTELFIAENNEIVEVYVGKAVQEGLTEVVLELKTMEFYSSQRYYGCVFVNERIAGIRDYNNEDTYVRVRVALRGEEEEIIAYAGVVSHPKKIDPHNHAALWQAFVNSPHKPFRGKLKDRPKWWVSNPIREKKRKRASTTQPQRLTWKDRESHAYLKKEEIREAIEAAMSPLTGERLRFLAVRALAVSGYSRQAAEALAQVATAARHGATMRGYAAMGLQNFTNQLPEDQKTAIRAHLRKALAEERAQAPNGLIRTLIGWGDAPYVNEILGKGLAGHPMEIEVLQALPDPSASERLWKMALACPRSPKESHYARLERIGRALAKRKDKRGIDVLMELLAMKQAPAPQYRNNIFQFVALKIGRSFGYPPGNYRPQLEQAIPKMLAWWRENREVHQFDSVKKPAR